MAETKKIDLSAKKTEAEWAETNDRFFLKATPVWFEWLEWIICQLLINPCKEEIKEK